ncbi:hypothetical protein [Leptospira idonii]|uniref:DUF2029 domain-containing protein n=1 Tax=Leptospira idonii TaxID=1193500 RepID=A0A4R9M9J4_9LEPT|nr:hypothetical protein [Leptospira idonii]TGN21128.1 hypothetical protein EHS15_01010 [Leptospira idonii]
MHIFVFILYAVILFLGAQFINREDWPNLLGFTCTAHFIFFLSFRYLDRLNLKTLILFAVFYRVILIGIEPKLSDDFYRFLWDGYLVYEGYNPFFWNPVEWLSQNGNPSEEMVYLFSRMNSPHYYSVYPSVLQSLFFLPWAFEITSLFWQTFFLQSCLFLFELINIFLTYKIKPTLAHSSYWVYWGNPLVIWEGISQIHPEPIIVTLLLVCILLYRLRRFSGISFVFPFLLQVKMNLIFLLPGIFFSIPKKYRISLLVFLIFSLVVLAFTVFGEYGAQSSQGIGLFLHSFRFHSLFESPIYYFLRIFDRLEYLSGTISLITGGCVYLYLVSRYKLDLSASFFFGYLCLLLFSPVIHPWYSLPLIALALERTNTLPWIRAFSFFCGLSYLFYGVKFESFGLIFLFLESIVYLWIIYGKQSFNYLRQKT